MSRNRLSLGYHYCHQVSPATQFGEDFTRGSVGCLLSSPAAPPRPAGGEGGELAFVYRSRENRYRQLTERMNGLGIGRLLASLGNAYSRPRRPLSGEDSRLPPKTSAGYGGCTNVATCTPCYGTRRRASWRAHCLREYDHKLGPAYAAKLEPLVAQFDHSVFIACDRELATTEFAAIEKLMHTINGAATKGEHDIFPRASDLLNHYWELASIFRESEYNGQSLAYNWQLDVRVKSKT